MTARWDAPATLLIVGAGVSGCALSARLRQLGWGGAITLLEAGRGAGGRAASRRSREDPGWVLDHGAPFLTLEAGDPPALLGPLLAAGCLQPWPQRQHDGTDAGLRQLQEDGTVLDEPGPFAAHGALYRGMPSMAGLAEGMLDLAEAWRQPAAAAAGAPAVRRIHGRRVDSLERRDGLWRLHAADGEPLAQGQWLVLSGTLLAHPRGRALLGWPEVPLLAASRDLDDAALTRALGRIAALRYDPRLALLLRLEGPQACRWLALPFRHLWFSEAARQRWGLERISVQPLPDGRCGVVAHARPEDLQRGSPGPPGLCEAEASVQEAAEIAALREALLHSLASWITAADLPRAEQLQRMRWGGAFPLAPGLDREAMICPASQLALCGDAIEGPGFGRVEGAWRSGEWLAQRLLPAFASVAP